MDNIGLDLHKRESQLCILTEDGEIVERRTHTSRERFTATSIRPYPNDDLMASNMSVWESLEALQQFVNKSGHVRTLRDRQQWFERIEGPILALWWIPAGQIPTLADARERGSPC